MAEERFHQAYLVRLWAVHGSSGLLWRAFIENIHTGERRAFADLSSLCNFLYEAAAPPAAATQGETDTAGAQVDEEL